MTVSADLPGLPGVPESVGPVRCPECGQTTADVRHARRLTGQDGSYTARLTCHACGLTSTLDADGYAAGLSVGVLVERARQAQPPAVTNQLTCPECLSTDFELWIGGKHSGEVSCRGCGLLFVPRAFGRARQDADDYHARMSLEAAQAEADLRASGYRDDDGT